MTSALLGIGFPEHVLTIPTGAWEQDPDGALDQDGNPVLTPITSSLTVLLKATSNGQIREQVGVDANTLALEGTCLNPPRFPPGVRPGTSARLTIEGTVGTLTILPWITDRHEAVVSAIGQKFAASWVATT